MIRAILNVGIGFASGWFFGIGIFQNLLVGKVIVGLICVIPVFALLLLTVTGTWSELLDRIFKVNRHN